MNKKKNKESESCQNNDRLQFDMNKGSFIPKLF